MKHLLILFLIFPINLLVAQSTFQREYGSASERTQDVAIAILVDATAITSVYSSEYGTRQQSTLEFVRTDPISGRLISQASVPYPFLGSFNSSVLIVKDSILVIASSTDNERINISRINAAGEVLAVANLAPAPGNTANFKLIAATNGEIVLTTRGGFVPGVWRFSEDFTSYWLSTFGNSEQELGTLMVLPDGKYLTFFDQAGGISTRLINPLISSINTVVPLPGSEGALTFAGSRLLTDPTDGSTVLVLMIEQGQNYVPLVYQLDSIGRATGDPYTLGILPQESRFLYGFTPDGELIYSINDQSLFAYSDYRQANNQPLPIASLPEDIGRVVNNPIVAYASTGDVYYGFTSCRNINNCDVVYTRAALNSETWRNRLGTLGQATNDQPIQIDTDPQANIYLLSESPEEEGTGLTTNILKLSPDGDTSWVRQLTAPGQETTKPLTMVLRGDGLLFVQHFSQQSIYTDVLFPDGSSAHPQFAEERLELINLPGQAKAIDLGGGVVLKANGLDTITRVDIHRADGSRRSSFIIDRISNPHMVVRLEDDFIMITGWQPDNFLISVVKYDLAGNQEVWHRTLGNPDDMYILNFAGDLIVSPDGSYLLAADTWSYGLEETLEGVSFYRISPTGDVDPPIFNPQEVVGTFQPMQLAVNADNEPILINYTEENGERLFRTTRFDANDLSVIQTSDVVLPETFAYAPDFTFSRRGFALCYGSVDPEGDRSRQLFLVSEKVITNPVANASVYALEADIQLFPNPTSGPATLTVDLSQASPLRLEVLDISGRKVFEAAYASSLRHQIDLLGDALPVGISALRIVDGEGRYRSLRIVKTR
jgi:hypothetical protein